MHLTTGHLWSVIGRALTSSTLAGGLWFKKLGGQIGYGVANAATFRKMLPLGTMTRSSATQTR